MAQNKTTSCDGITATNVNQLFGNMAADQHVRGQLLLARQMEEASRQPVGQDGFVRSGPVVQAKPEGWNKAMEDVAMKALALSRQCGDLMKGGKSEKPADRVERTGSASP